MDEAEASKRPARVTLKDISSFLLNHLDDKDRSASLEERTNCAIVLLESLPCGRYAVLEKIGEVFFDEAQSYVLELERLHLAGMPAICETTSSKLDTQIRKIQQVLVSFVEANSKAWGPMIFQWTVQTLSQICGQYGTKRHFSSFCLEERFQMWLNCTATVVLLEIMVSCLYKIIHKNQDNCMKCLLNAALCFAPYFNWVLAHTCCIFPDILPYKLLCHASEAFSKQSRKIEVIMDTMLSIFDLIHSQKEEHINNALFKLFTKNMTKEIKEKEDHGMLCAIPFLLHICSKSIKLLKPLVKNVIESLTHDNLQRLQEQSLRRDDVLQRRSLNRIADCIKAMDQSGLEILLFLVKYSCQEDDMLIEENPMLAASTQTYCSLILELLRLVFVDEINMYLHYDSHNIKEENSIQTIEKPLKVAFLNSLQTNTKQLCKVLLNSTGSKKDVVQEFLKLIGLQEGLPKMLEILAFILVNSPLDSSKSSLVYLISTFKVHEADVIKQTFANIFTTLTCDKNFSFRQAEIFLKNILKLVKEEKCGLFQKTSVISYLKPYVNCFAQVIVLSSDKDVIPASGIELLQKLSLPDLPVSDYAVIVQATLCYYFECMRRLTIQGNIEDYWWRFESCNQLLLKVLSQYIGVQQFIIRVLLDGNVLEKGEKFLTETEKPLIKVELLKQNLSMVQSNRFNTITSVTFKDGLKLTKRVHEDQEQWKKSYTCQLFINTLTNLLSCSSFGSTKKTSHTNIKGNKFTHHWSEKKYIKVFPTSQAFIATALVELICPEMVPVVPWPDEEFLKYTIERDLRVKNAFDTHPILWEVLELISVARPSLYHCSVIIHSLFGMSLKFWQTNRNSVASASSVELNNTRKLMQIIRNAGWLPPDFDCISDIFQFISPKEVYDILRVLWTYMKNTSFVPHRFIDRDIFGLLALPVNTEFVGNIKAVVSIIFLRNIAKIGYLYSRFLGENSM